MSGLAMQNLIDVVVASTVPYRKGEVVKVRDGVTSIDAFPESHDAPTDVDVHFITVGFTEAAAIPHHEFYDLVIAATSEHGEFVDLSIDDLRGGPSYITLGGWLGDQTLALRFMALGQLHGLWEVVTPARLGATGALADQLAGQGYVMSAGLKEPAVTS